MYCGGECLGRDGVPGSPNKDGCVAERPADDCYYPCGGIEGAPADELGGIAGGADQSCEGVADTSSTVTMTGTSDPSTESDATLDDTSSATMSSMTQGSATESEGSTEGGGSCQTSAECMVAGFPVCLDNECEPCTETPDGDLACATKNEGFPVCAPSGECVQCNDTNASACTDTTPIFDVGASMCVGCTFHEQCPDSACRIATGACFDSAEVYDVGAGETYTSITAAHADIGDGAQVVLRLHAGASFDESVTLSGANTAYALLAADAVPQWINSTGGAATLRVQASAEAYVQDIRLALNADTVAITADDARLYLDRAQVVNNSAGGILLTAGANGYLRNCFVGGNFADVTAMSVNASTAELTYTTMLGGGATAVALACNATGSATVRNSLIVATTDTNEISCALADVTYSATESNTPGTGNVPLDAMNNNWFVMVNSNLHITGNAPDEILSTAQWQTGDPPTDIDVTEDRPNADGTADVAGADIP